MTAAALFTGPWAAGLERELAADLSYQRAAARWNGRLMFVAEADFARGIDSERRLFLDLDRGIARAIRPALPGDEREATYRLAAPAAVWLEVLSGGLEPAGAVMSGKLRLERGSLFSLLPHIEAARQLLACARRIDLTPAAPPPAEGG